MRGSQEEEIPMKFRNAVREDIPLILSFIKELAAYEKMSGEVIADEKTLQDLAADQTVE